MDLNTTFTVTAAIV